MSKDFRKGDRVRWNSEAGEVRHKTGALHKID